MPLDWDDGTLSPFGAYCETHEDNEPTNSMQSRALPTICLGPTDNFQGSYHFLNLLTGLVVGVYMQAMIIRSVS
jgi:hypothetical protein